jgi:predicted NBD/HSP70 family sugar kinase
MGTSQRQVDRGALAAPFGTGGMAVKRATSQRLGESNRLLVLNHLRRRSVASMHDLVRDTGRSQPTVLKWLAELERAGLVQRRGLGASSGGRPPTLYEFDATAGLVVGVSVEIPSVTVALLDLNGRTVASESGAIRGLGPPELVRRELHGLTRRFVERHVGAGSSLVHAGIAFSGFIDRDAGLSLATPRLRGWHDVPIRTDLEHLLGCPVVLNHHIDALTQAELHLGAAREVDDFLFFDFGYGLGVRAVRTGQPLIGRFGNAGLIGHTTVVPDGRPCLCGNRGCLEAYVSGRALLRHAGPDDDARDEDDVIARTVERLLDDAADDADRQVRDELEAFLALGLANAINTFDQPTVVLSGFANAGGPAFRERLLARTRGLLQPTLAGATRLVFSRLPRLEAGAQGAALYALSHHLPFADPLVVPAPTERSPHVTESDATTTEPPRHATPAPR